jgi:hypothetical protein
MMRALVLSMLWLLAGAALAASLFWAFLNTPESTVFTLALSASLGLAIYAVIGASLGGALGGWATAWHAARRHAAAGVPALLLPLLFALAAWWLVGQAIHGLDTHSGEISAWFIARLDWADVRPLLNGVRVAGEWLRRVLVPFAALVWLGRLATLGWRPLVDRSMVRQALSPLRLVLVTAIALATVWAPVTYGLYWMPSGVPPTWMEPAVATLKFAIMAVVAALGISVICRLAAPARS